MRHLFKVDYFNMCSITLKWHGTVLKYSLSTKGTELHVLLLKMCHCCHQNAPKVKIAQQTSQHECKTELLMWMQHLAGAAVTVFTSLPGM